MLYIFGYFNRKESKFTVRKQERVKIYRHLQKRDRIANTNEVKNIDNVKNTTTE